MAMGSAAYEPFAWWLTREQIGLCLRERYRLPKKESPPRLLALIKKLEAVEDNQVSQTLVGKLDAIEGNQLLRSCRRRLRV